MSRKFVQNMIQIVITVLFFNLMAPVFSYAGTPSNVVLSFGSGSENDYGALVSRGSVAVGAYSLQWHAAPNSVAGPSATDVPVYVAENGTAPFEFNGSPAAIDGAVGTMEFKDSSGTSIASMSASSSTAKEDYYGLLKTVASPAKLLPIESAAASTTGIDDGFGTNYYYDSTTNVLHIKDAWAAAMNSIHPQVLCKVMTGPAVSVAASGISMKKESGSTNAGIGACLFGFVPTVQPVGYRWVTVDTGNIANNKIINISSGSISLDLNALLTSELLSTALAQKTYDYFFFDNVTQKWYRFSFQVDRQDFYEASNANRKISDKMFVEFGDSGSANAVDTFSIFKSNLPELTGGQMYKAQWTTNQNITRDFNPSSYAVGTVTYSAAKAKSFNFAGSTSTALVNSTVDKDVFIISSGAAIIYATYLQPGLHESQIKFLEENADSVPQGMITPIDGSNVSYPDSNKENYRIVSGVLEMKESWVKSVSDGNGRLRVALRQSVSDVPIVMSNDTTGEYYLKSVVSGTGISKQIALPATTDQYVALDIMDQQNVLTDAYALNRMYFYNDVTKHWVKANYKVLPDNTYAGGTSTGYFDGFMPQFTTTDSYFALCGLPVNAVPNGTYTAEFTSTDVTPMNASVPVYIKNGASPFVQIPGVSNYINKTAHFLLRNSQGVPVFSAYVKTQWTQANKDALRNATSNKVAYARPSFVDSAGTIIALPNTKLENYIYSSNILQMQRKWAASQGGSLRLAISKDFAGSSLIDLRQDNTGPYSLDFLSTQVLAVPILNDNQERLYNPIKTALADRLDKNYTGYVFNRGSGSDWNWYRVEYVYKTSLAEKTTTSAITTVNRNPVAGSIIDAKSGLTTAMISGSAVQVVYITFSKSTGAFTQDGFKVGTLSKSNISPSGIAGAVINASLISDKNISSLYKMDAGGTNVTVYLPIISLMAGLEYFISIPQGVVEDDSGSSSAESWSFTTYSLPSLTGGVWPASFDEDYDSGAAVNITGVFGTTTEMEVYFGGVKASKLSISTTPAAIAAYLPTGSSKLAPGIYDVEVKYQGKTMKRFAGGLSIVASGKIFPDSDTLLDKSHTEGNISMERKVSSDTLYLSERYSAKDFLELDMDDLFGVDTMLRKIVFNLVSGERAPEVQLDSKWFDMTLNNFERLKNENEDATLSINRISGIKLASLVQSLRNRPLKSSCVQVKIEGAKVDNFSLSLPLTTEPTMKTKAIRYDENTRKWSLAKTFVFDAATQRAIVSDNKPGIFVVVD